MRKTSLFAPPLLLALCSLGSSLAGDDLRSAWLMSQGGGVTIAVVTSEGSPLLDSVRATAPAATVIAAESLARAEKSGARVILLPQSERRLKRSLGTAIAHLASAHVVLVAPAGDEGLSHEHFPAAAPGVIAAGTLAPTSNRGPHTIVLDAPSSTEAAARLAGVAALALGYDPEITTTELTAALKTNPPGKALDVRGVLEKLRPRSKAFTISEARVLPTFAAEGERARVRVRVSACGRNPARGTVSVAIPGSALLTIPFGPLAPGEDATVEGEFVPHGAGFAPIRTSDGGVVPGVGLEATFRAGSPGDRGEEARARFTVVPGDLHPPALRVTRIEARPALEVAVTIENAGRETEREGFVRLVHGKDTLAEARVPELAAGESGRVVLVGRLAAGTTSRIEARVEVGRRPQGFRESVDEDRVLRLDPAGARAPRGRTKDPEPAAPRKQTPEHNGSNPTLRCLRNFVTRPLARG